MSHFRVKKVTQFTDLQVDQELPTSDFALLDQNNKFVQLEYVHKEAKETEYPVNPGLYTMAKDSHGMKLVKTVYTQEPILTSASAVDLVSTQISSFFKKLDVYLKYGINIPKRGWLLWGVPGCGKSTSLTQITNKLLKDTDTLIVTWPSDRYEPYEVKDFVKRFQYNNVKKFVLIIEDLGGAEQDAVRIKSMSSLLSLLDNVETTFTLPTAIVATTNFPENFLGNIANRPGRFDTKVEIKPPTAAQRVEFLKFFSNNTAPEECLAELAKKAYNDLTPAHIKEILFRSELNDLNMVDALREVQKEVEHYNKAFETNKKKLGIIDPDDYP